MEPSTTVKARGRGRGEEMLRLATPSTTWTTSRPSTRTSTISKRDGAARLDEADANPRDRSRLERHRHTASSNGRGDGCCTSPNGTLARRAAPARGAAGRAPRRATDVIRDQAPAARWSSRSSSHASTASALVLGERGAWRWRRRAAARPARLRVRDRARSSSRSRAADRRGKPEVQRMVCALLALERVARADAADAWPRRLPSARGGLPAGARSRGSRPRPRARPPLRAAGRPLDRAPRGAALRDRPTPAVLLTSGGVG